MDPTALTRLSKDRLGPSYNNTAKLSSNSWTFNKTLSNLIRQNHHSLRSSRHIFHTRLRSLFITSVYSLFLQEEHSEISWSRERHLHSEGHAETRRYHPLCFWPTQHHKHLRKSLPSFANCIPHEEPTSQALCYCGKLWDPAEQQLWTRDWLTRLCYQVFFRVGSLPFEINHKNMQVKVDCNWNGLPH